MINNNTTIPPERVRVSIFERIVPFGAMAVAVFAGQIGAYLIAKMLLVPADAENLGVAALSGGLAEQTVYPLVLLYAAAALGIVAICVAIGRLVIATKTASPSGISYIVLGILSLVPVALVWNAGSLIISVLVGRSTLSVLGLDVAVYCFEASIVAWPILLVLLAWSLIPFKSRPGRRFGPIICLVLIEIMLLAAAVAFQLRIYELYTIRNAS